MHIDGPKGIVQSECEGILRSVPEWFGIEESLLEYVANTKELPTFLIRDTEQALGFLSLREHFPSAWEIDCVAIHAGARGRGYGRMLLNHAEQWLLARGAKLLQVKTIAATSPNPHYAETRVFYERMGFAPVEVFPLLWAEHNPCLQMMKVLG
jgi:GNAT superfamily N-acetyltransferase